MPLPRLLRLNAFVGSPDPGSALHPSAQQWIARDIRVKPETLRPEPPADLAAWAHPEVGWGLVLPENPALSQPERATAVDAPEPIQRLLQHRHGVVLRWAPDLQPSKIRRYFEDGFAQEPHLALSERGVARGRVPRYLMICASPEQIPWEFQYRLNAVSFVGRLDLDLAGLTNYVDAAVTDWREDETKAKQVVVWAVDDGEDDITHLMRSVVAKKVFDKLSADKDIGAGAVFFDGSDRTATVADLIAALEQSKPGLIVTTSHGMTGPLSDIGSMSSQLGILVDGHHQLLPLKELLARWSPAGAIWYAHACCSAGSDAQTMYEGLVAPGSLADQVLKGVARCGARVAPLPRALLGAKRPLRAFLGHVEPTFNWTLRDNATGQILTSSLVEALYNGLYSQDPVGYAFSRMHGKAPVVERLHRQAKRDFNAGADTVDDALACRLVAQDIECLVILGDPAAALPAL